MDLDDDYEIISEIARSDEGFYLYIVVKVLGDVDLGRDLIVATDEFMELSNVVQAAVDACMNEIVFIDANFGLGEYHFKREFTTPYREDPQEQIVLANRALDECLSLDTHTKEEMDWLEDQLGTINDS